MCFLIIFQLSQNLRLHRMYTHEKQQLKTLFFFYFPVEHTSNLLATHAELPPTHDLHYIINAAGRDEVRWPTQANERNSGSEQRRLGTALPRGRTEAAQTDSGTPAVIPESLLGVM